MSKKKRRYAKKHRRSAAPQTSSFNLHHILWIRRKWDKASWSHKLRNHPYMKVSIPKDTLHKWIHQAVYEVPIPREIICQKAYEEIERLYKFGAISDNDNIIKRLDLLIFILKYVADDTVAALEAQKEIATRFYHKGD